MKKFGLKRLGLALGATVLLTVGLCAPASVSAAPGAPPAPSCSDLLVPQHQVDGHTVGEASCQVNSTSTVNDIHGRSFDVVDVGLSGTAAGASDLQQNTNRRKDLTEDPNVLLTQFGIGSWKWGVGTYNGVPTATDAGAGITVLYPDPSAHTPWNGKIFAVYHGQSNDTPMGDLVPRSVGSGVDPDEFNNLFVSAMIDQGYAVVYTRRPASSGVPITLDDGTKLDGSLNDNLGTAIDFMESGKKLIEARLGHKASDVYWYGHSAGVILGRTLNYSGMNYDPATHQPYFNAFLSDDPGGGLPLPLSMPEGQVLGERGNVPTYNPAYELSASAKSRMVPELSFFHQLYQDKHSWLPDVSYLNLKLAGTKLYEEEGLGNKTRGYQVNGVSHISNTSSSPAHTLDIGPLVYQAIINLDAWVHGVTPPPTMADLAQVGGHNTHGVPSAVQLPPIACPTGYRYAAPAPTGASSSTGYAPYDGTSLEPINSAGVLQDVNGNGYRDAMPSISQAWQRLGLVHGHQQVTPQVFMACVRQNTTMLVQQRLIQPAAATAYLQQAAAFPNLDW